jgi:hypothetical protein
MLDIIYGTVDTLIDDVTFIMNVREAYKSNEGKYNRWERIRIANIESEELDMLGGKRDKAKLESVIQGRVVRCSVQSRDTLGRVVADVKVI